MEGKRHYQVVIVGSGPSGLTAAIYTARANRSSLVVNGQQPGGQLTITTDVENFPGFPEGILGPELMERMRKQAERFGAEFIQGSVTDAELGSRPFSIRVEGVAIDAETLIICSGASARLLGLEDEQAFVGKGLSACATCDGFFYKDREVLVIGGGDSAIEEALFLTKFASKVTIVHRRDQLRASKIMQKKARENEKIDFLWDCIAEGLLGDPEKEGISGARLKNVKSGEIFDKQCHGIFAAIGHDPNTRVFKDQVEMDEKGYIKTFSGTRTSVPGVFTAGDVQDPSYRQAITAAGSGCMAAIDADRFLEAAEQ